MTVRKFLVDEWLPTQASPTLEESTYRSYTRYVHLHVVPHIGGIALQQLTPLDLTSMYRVLLESGRRPPTPPTRVHPPEVGELVAKLQGEGTHLAGRRRRGRRGVPRRSRTDPPRRRRAAPPATSPPTHRAARWTQAAHGPLRPLDRPRRAEGRDAVEPCRPQRRRRRHSASARLDPPRPTHDVDCASSSAGSSTSSPTTATSCRGSSSPPPDAGAASASACGGPTSTSTARRR